MQVDHGSAAATFIGSDRVDVIPMHATLGAEVRCGDLRQLEANTFTKIRAAFLDNLVILIRGQPLSIEEFLSFARRFGELAQSPPLHIGQGERLHPSLGIVSNVKENGRPIGSLGDGEAVWHSDSNFLRVPPSLSLLHSVEIPPTGGNTCFANMYAALENLPGDLRSAIRGRTIKHDQRFSSAGHLRPGYDPDQDIRESPGESHPIVRKHPDTGCNALYLGRRPHAYINGLPLGESEAILDGLWRHAAKLDYTWEHEWKVGDTLVWDNRCAMHRRDAFDPASRRIMLRTQCKGNAVVEAADETAPHPRARTRRSA